MRFSLPEAWQEALISRDEYLVLGRVGMDLYPLPQGTPIAKAHQFQSDVGGSAGNMAVALRQAGCQVALISSLSDDGVGAFVRQKLQDYDVDSRLIGTSTGQARTSLALAETIAQSPNVVIYRNQAADLQLDEARLAAIDFEKAKALILTGTALSSPPALEVITTLSTRAKQAGCPVILDIDYRAMAWNCQRDATTALQGLLPAIDIIIGNDDEFAVMADGDAKDGYDYAKSIAGLGHLIIYKKGSLGCETLYEDAAFSTGIYHVTLAKPFGAGDAFAGNLFAALAAQDDLADAIQKGAAAAALVVSQQGCASAMPTKDALDAFMAKTAYQA